MTSISTGAAMQQHHYELLLLLLLPRLLFRIIHMLAAATIWTCLQFHISMDLHGWSRKLTAAAPPPPAPHGYMPTGLPHLSQTW
jgi:hypothetical protein